MMPMIVIYLISNIQLFFFICCEVAVAHLTLDGCICSTVTLQPAGGTKAEAAADGALVCFYVYL